MQHRDEVLDAGASVERHREVGLMARERFQQAKEFDGNHLEYVPDFPPDLESSAMSLKLMPLSTALHMS